MFCYQTPENHCPIRVEDCPVVALPRLPRDELAGRTTDWQKAAAELFVQRLLMHKMEIEKMLEQARYYHIPIGNIPEDVVLFGADIFYARSLQRAGQLLWCSKSSRPDLGGREKDLARLEADSEDLTPETDKKGFYHGATIELNVNGMVEAALLQSHNLTELDGFETFQQGSVDVQFKGNVLFINLKKQFCKVIWDN